MRTRLAETRGARYAEVMAKTAKKSPEVTVLAQLVARASPGCVSLVKPAYAVRQGRQGYEITMRHRGVPVTYAGDSIEEVASDVLGYIDDPAEDPIVPDWTRLSRVRTPCTRPRSSADDGPRAFSGA